MALVLVATPGAANANSYLTLAEATAYYEGRLTSVAWDNAADQEALLVMATRTINGYFLGRRTAIMVEGNVPAYRVGARWTGAPADGVQSLAWPRAGMYNGNGYAIAGTAIPRELKDATAELAIQTAGGNTTLDIASSVKGITSIKAGGVAIGFGGQNSQTVTSKPLPDAVLMLIPPSWYEPEVVESAYGGVEFEALP